MQLHKSLRTQLFVNNIALLLTNTKITSINENNVLKLAESLIQTHNSIASVAGSDTNINLIKGIDWEGGKVTDINDAVNSSSAHISGVVNKLISEMEKLIIQEYKHGGKDIPMRLSEANERIMDDYESVGYAALDRYLIVKSDNQNSLNAVKEILNLENGNNVGLIIPKDKGSSLEISFPHSLTGDTLHTINSFNSLCEDEFEHIQVGPVEILKPSIPGMRDISDVEMERSKRINREQEQSYP